MKVYYAFAKQAIIGGLAYRGSFFLQIFTSMLFLLANLFVWRALYNTPAAATANVGFEQMAVYLVGASLLRSLISFNDGLVESRIRTGEIVSDVMKPYNFPLHLLFRGIGESALRFVMVGVPTLLVVTLIYKVPLPRVENLLQFLPALCGAFILSFVVSLPFWLISFWTIEVSGLVNFKYILTMLFAGQIVPLWFFPEWLAKIAYCLPFQGLYYLPLSLYVGAPATPPLASVLTIQAIWIVVFTMLGWAMWRAAFRRLVVQGG